MALSFREFLLTESEDGDKKFVALLRDARGSEREYDFTAASKEDAMKQAKELARSNGWKPTITISEKK